MSSVKFDKAKDGNTTVTGIYGNQNNAKLRGWESGTTGVGGDVRVRLGHQQGVPSLDHNTVSIDEPLRLGRFICVWLRLPTFIHADVRSYWNYFFQDKVLEFNGLADNEIGVMSRTSGAVGRQDEYAGFYKENNNKFQIKVPEVKGSPVRKLCKYYVTGLSDSVTGVAHFHGNADLRFSKINYGGDFLYVLLGPTMRPDDIEFACAYFNCFMTKDYIGHLNSGAIGEPGDAGLTFDIEFAGYYVQNNTINKLAMKIVEAVGLYKDCVEDIVLPAYVYESFLKDGNAPNLAEAYGVYIDAKLARAKTSADTAALTTGLGDFVTDYAVGNTPQTTTVLSETNTPSGPDIVVPTV